MEGEESEWDGKLKDEIQLKDVIPQHLEVFTGNSSDKIKFITANIQKRKYSSMLKI